MNGCATTAPPELVNARNAYARASAGPAAQVAPAEVHKAEMALTEAERAFSNDKDAPHTRDLAYVAERKAETAEAIAAAMSAEKNSAAAKQQYEQKQDQIVRQTRGELGKTQAQLADAEKSRQQGQAELETERQARVKAEQQAAAAADALSKLQAKEEARGSVITLSGSVLFKSNESTLLPEAQTRLNDVADALIANKDRNVVIEGHTDSRGNPGHNVALSQQRAEAVRTYLVSRGYPSERITARGIGQERPIADNASAEGRANNRRVEIVIQPKVAQNGPATKTQ